MPYTVPEYSTNNLLLTAMLHRLKTTDSDTDIQLDKYLSRQLPELSRTSIRKIIDIGGVHLAGRRTKESGALLKSGQQIELHYDKRPLDIYRISEEDILFQDQFLIVLNKHAGVETQPTPSRYKGTLYEALQIWLNRDQKFGRKLHIGMAQRLDRGTTGVIAFSIHPRSHKGLTHQIQNRQAKKNYLAAVSGTPQPEEGTFHSLLARQRKSNRMKSVAKGGKEAITHYKVVRSTTENSLISVQLETGRTHQIRVHFSEAGHPLIGDSRYGGPEYCSGHRCTSQWLHSWKLGLRHPIDNRPLTFTVPPPKQMQEMFSYPENQVNNKVKES